METVVLTVTEAAEHLRLGRTTIYRLIASEELKSFKIGGCRRISLESLKSFVHQSEGRN